MADATGGGFPYPAAHHLLRWAASQWSDLQYEAGWSTPLEALSARRAYPMLYARIIHDLDEDSRLEVDAILGDDEAVRVRNERRRELILSAGIEIA